MLPDAEQMLEQSMPLSDTQQNERGTRRNLARNEEGWLRGLNIGSESFDLEPVAEDQPSLPGLSFTR